jgi:hypothetical protein
MLRIRKAGGAELSSGDGSNPAFDDSRPDEDGVQAEANDIALLEVYCDEGESFSAVVVPGVPELRYRVADGDWLAPGADAPVGAVASDAPVPLSVRVHLAADPAPSLPRATGTVVEAATASGSVGVLVTLAGHSYAVPAPSGSVSTIVGAHAHAVAMQQAAGSVSARLGVFGHVVADALGMVQNLMLTPGTTSILAEWDAPSSGTPLGYEVRLDDDAWTDVGTDTEYEFTGLDSITEYEVSVRAYDEAGAGPTTTTTTTTIPVFTLPWSEAFSSYSVGEQIAAGNSVLIHELHAANTQHAATVSGTRMVDCFVAASLPAYSESGFSFGPSVALPLDTTEGVVFSFKTVCPQTGGGPAYPSAPMFWVYDFTGRVFYLFTVPAANATSNDGKIRAYNGTAFEDVITGLVGQQLYTVDVRMRRGEDKADVRVNGGSWTAATLQDTVATTVPQYLTKALLLHGSSPGATRKAAFGAVSITGAG